MYQMIIKWTTDEQKTRGEELYVSDSPPYFSLIFDFQFFCARLCRLDHAGLWVPVRL